LETKPQDGWLPQPNLRRGSESFIRAPGDLVPEDVVRGSGEFMSQGLEGDDLFGLGEFALDEASGWRAVTAGMVGGFDEGPAEVLVAVFAVALALRFRVGEPPALDAATGGGVVADLREAADIAGL